MLPSPNSKEVINQSISILKQNVSTPGKAGDSNKTQKLNKLMLEICRIYKLENPTNEELNEIVEKINNVLNHLIESAETQMGERLSIAKDLRAAQDLVTIFKDKIKDLPRPNLSFKNTESKNALVDLSTQASSEINNQLIEKRWQENAKSHKDFFDYEESVASAILELETWIEQNQDHSRLMSRKQSLGIKKNTNKKNIPIKADVGKWLLMKYSLNELRIIQYYVNKANGTNPQKPGDIPDQMWKLFELEYINWATVITQCDWMPKAVANKIKNLKGLGFVEGMSDEEIAKAKLEESQQIYNTEPPKYSDPDQVRW